MNKNAAVVMALLAALPFAARADAVRDYLKRRFNAEDLQVQDVQGLQARIHDGKLVLHVRDFIELALKNSADVQLSRVDVYTSADRITSAESPFDPLLQASFNSQRAVSPLFFGGGFGSTGAGSSFGTGTTSTGTSTGSGTGTGASTSGIAVLPQTISSLTQTSVINYQQLLPTGQTIQASFQGIRSSGDDYTSPVIFGSLNFTLLQPLLQNRTNLQARGPLTVARTQLLITSEQDEAKIADTISQAAQTYWQAVQARENIRVQQQTVELAKKSYEHDKLALELGALASLDIYQSQTQVAERNRDLVQAQHQYRIALDTLRHFIGADLTQDLRNTDIVLEDDPAQLPPKSEVLPFEQALQRALERRPEWKAARQSLEVDALNTRVARDALLPQLSLTGTGGSTGPSLNPVTPGTSVGVPANLYPGLGETLKQVLAFDFPSYGFGLQLNFPLRNSSAKAQLADAMVSRVQDRYRQRQTQQQITLDVRQAIDSLELAGASIATATTARDLAHKNVDAEQQKYQLGSITAFELLDSQTRLASAESALLSAFITYQQGYVAYQRATWTLFDGYGVILQTPKAR